MRNRITELRRVRAGDLRPNPRNWREHPEPQRAALRAVLDEVGWADAVIARQLEDGSLELIDGHLRAETEPDAEIPVLITDLNQAESDKVLATLDPLAAMAEVNAARLNELLALIDTESDSLLKVIDDLRERIPVEVEPLTFDDPPDSVEANLAELEALRARRRADNENVTVKNDTEKYLIVVYPTRAAKAAVLLSLGLPEDERYVHAHSVKITSAQNLKRAVSDNGRSVKAASPKKSGANG